MKKILSLCFLFLLLLNCNDTDDDSDVSDCYAVACTEIYISFNLTVKDSSGAAIALDRFEVLDKETSEIITITLDDNQLQLAKELGQYPIYDDSFVSENQNSQKSIVFSGYVNEEQIIETEYSIDIDCCHISLVSGDTDITIN